MNQNAKVYTNSMERIQNISAQIRSAEEAMISDVDVDKIQRQQEIVDKIQSERKSNLVVDS